MLTNFYKWVARVFVLDVHLSLYVDKVIEDFFVHDTHNDLTSQWTIIVEIFSKLFWSGPFAHLPLLDNSQAFLCAHYKEKQYLQMMLKLIWTKSKA